MKIILILLCIVCTLSGCATLDYETIGDDLLQIPEKTPCEMAVTLPKDAVQISYHETGKFYCCDGYEMTMEILPAGDISQTLEDLTGYSQDCLTVLETGTAELYRYECTWVTAGEGSDQVGRTVILDDGNFHYCISLMSRAEDAGSLQETWQELLKSFALQS
jgi:hypothetical protein